MAFARGEGAHLWDVNGKKYVDLLAGIAVTSLGHCNPELVDVLNEQTRALWHVSNLAYSQPQVELARKLVGTTEHLSRCFFCNPSTGVFDTCAAAVCKKQSANGTAEYKGRGNAEYSRIGGKVRTQGMEDSRNKPEKEIFPVLFRQKEEA